MPAKHPPLNVDNALRLYLAGEPFEQIRAATGVSPSSIQAERAARGIPPRPRTMLPAEQIVAAYVGGASENALSKQHGVSRSVIRQRLIEAGVEIRSYSDAAFKRAEHMTKEERRTNAAAAHRASRLRRAPQIELLRRALTNERDGRPESEGERLLYDMLTAQQLKPTAQRAIGTYNVDLAIAPVAVEVLGGGWHSYKPVHAERTPYILDEGWHLVMVWNFEGVSRLGPGAAEYVVSFVEEMRRNPPATCQYRVIGGQGQLLAARGREDNEFPLVPPPRGAF